MSKDTVFTKQELLGSGQFTPIEKAFLDAIVQEKERLSVKKARERLKKEQERKVV